MTRLFTVDAFTDVLFSGNPAGVCLLSGPADERWMQLVAREMSLSETAFLWREGDGYRLRWFTPLVEIDLCGHATLASAHILWQEGLAPAGKPIAFLTRGGQLTASREADGEEIRLDFPQVPQREVPAPPLLLEALNTNPRYVARKGETDFLVEIDSEETLRALRPDLVKIKEVARGVLVTARSSDPGYDFVSRFFAPRVGVDEDPVTGSAHCCLGPYWQKRLGKSRFRAYQASARGGTLGVRVTGDRVELSGRAVTFLRGEISAPARPLNA